MQGGFFLIIGREFSNIILGASHVNNNLVVFGSSMSAFSESTMSLLLILVLQESLLNQI